MNDWREEITLNIEGIKIIGQELNRDKTEKLLIRIAKSNKNILILGETGTGKDVLAKKIHDWSDKRNDPFVAINCASIPHELFEAELFGFSKGSFTGAYNEKIGLLEAAQNGTIFLDEIGELSLFHQAKLLRVVENKIFRRIGETKERLCKARFIFATNKDLVAAVKSGSFRQDLYYRISIVQIYISPLRFNLNIIPSLIKSILDRENENQNQNKVITKEAIRKLMSYDYPGNIRELINIIERAFLLSDDDMIKPDDIHFDNIIHKGTNHKAKNGLSVDRLREVLEACRWNKSEAAKRIGTSRRHLYRLIQKYKIDCVI
ncbi:MAG: sigma-54 dependent transcriptional regulator [Candidatus Aminicenantes bacterium]|nr:sigma-54 dependent transcriptional regulator [Candidatus Aminicenantes bacterium]